MLLVALAAALAAASSARGERSGLPAEPGVHVEPISGFLGLADVAVRPRGLGLDEQVAAIVLLLEVWGADAAETLRVPMRPPRHRGIGEDAHPPAAAAWSARVMAGPARVAGEDEPIVFAIEFLLTTGETVTRGPFSAAAQPRPELHTPDWAKGAVWYQIMPERFRNGNPENDPRGLGVFPKRWTSAWSVVEPGELEHARAAARAESPPRFLPAFRPGGQFYNIATARRYGGDLQGVVEKLDYLEDLGVDGIYLTPLFRAASHHKYDATDYRHIDETLGSRGRVEPRSWLMPSPPSDPLEPSTWPWTEADRYFVDVLLAEARKRGIRVIIDGVWNHTGRLFWAFGDLAGRGVDSSFADWYDARFAPTDPREFARFKRAHPMLDVRPGSLIGWRAWDRRNGNLPAFARTPEGRLHPDVERHIRAVALRWMDPSGDGDPRDGVDGWRLDVAADMPIPFWRHWREHVKSVNPEALLVGELWFKATAYLNGVAFDAQMNYPFAAAAVEWLAGHASTSASRLGERLDRVFDHAPSIDLCQLNLLGSHDTARLATMLNNPHRGYNEGAKLSRGARGYRTGRPAREIYELAVLGAALQATWPGAPMIYYGDEWGMHGADDPDCRKPLPWPDLGPNDDPDDDAQPGVREGFRYWFRLRKHPVAGPVLRYGDVDRLDASCTDVFAFHRRLNDLAVTVVLNRADAPFDAASLLQGTHSTTPLDTMRGYEVPPRSARAWLTR